MNVSRIGLDLAKTVFPVHGVDDQDRPVVSKSLKRRRRWGSSASCRPAWWRWRPVAARRPGWPAELLRRRPTNVAVGAPAQNNARVVWALPARGETYRPAATRGPDQTCNTTLSCAGDAA